MLKARMSWERARRDDPVLDRGTPSMNCLESRAFRKTTVC